GGGEEEARVKAAVDVGVQLALPCAIQVVSTPLHLMGLDLYNHRSGAAGAGSGGGFGARVGRVAKEYVPSTLARMGRILPAFGIGGVLNKWTRRTVNDALQ
ncbi:hypothetical protein DFJ73DRAFT_922545, partial [Zopfochytrium polystomum]